MTKGRAGRSFEWSFALRAKLKAACLVMCSSLVLLGSPLCVAAINFAAPTSYPVGTSPVAIAVGDFNGDGKIDIAVANTGSGDVSILLGNGDGTFQAARNFSAGNSPTAIAVGDFNGDGKLDLAVEGASAVASSVSILLGNGDGTFQAPKTLSLTASLAFMAVADFDGDKKSDLAVCDSANLNIFISSGDGTFQAAKTSALSSGCRGLFTADFNGDTKADLGLITADGLTTGAIQILLGNGDGTFSTGALINYSGEHLPIIATDLNGDGKVDLVLSASHVSCQSGPPTICQATVDIGVFLGNGDGTFQNEKSVGGLRFGVPSGSAAPTANPIVGDFNGDGKLDLAYHATFAPGAHVSGLLLGKGDGSFSSSVQDVPLPGNAPSIAQDLNGDKLADLIAIAVGTPNTIEVWLNTSPNSGADLGLLSPTVSAGPYVVGTNVTFTAGVVNQGPQDATGVVFMDTLPGGLTFVSATATPGSCVQANGVVSCTIGALASAFDSSVSIVATPTAIGTISNAMNVSGSEPDPVSANNTATQTVTIVPLVMLTVTDAGKGSGTLVSNPGNINCGSTCSGNFAQGITVALGANAAAGSVFSGWSGACTGSDPFNCSVTMNTAQSVTATFAPGPDFTLASTSSSLTLKTGAQATDALTLTGQNGFSGQVSLSCTVTGAAPLAACSVSPGSVTLGTGTANSELTVTAPTSLATFTVPTGATKSMAAYAAILPFPFLFIGGMALASRGSRKRRPGLLLLCGSLVVLLSCLAGCGAGSPPPPPQNYTITVTATSATVSVQHTTKVSLTVN